MIFKHSVPTSKKTQRSSDDFPLVKQTLIFFKRSSETHKYNILSEQNENLLNVKASGNLCCALRGQNDGIYFLWFRRNYFHAHEDK